MSSRSATLLGLGLLMLGIAATATAFERAPAPVPSVLAEAPTRPPVVQNRDAVRQATNLSDAFVSIADAVTPAVVRISAEQRHPAPQSEWLSERLQEIFGPAPDSGRARDPLPPSVAGGSGFLISADGFILTNNHVIEDAGTITVMLADKRTYEADVVGRDPTTDLAVVKIDATALPALALGDSDAARVGEWVIAVGNPGFDDASTLDFTVTGGIISAKGRPLNLIPDGLAAADPVSGSYAIEDFLQTDAVVNPGNSGGPLLNLRGEVIGVNTAIASSTGYSQGYAFAIPSNLAARVMHDLIRFGHVQRPMLGVQIADVTSEDAQAYGLTAIVGARIEDFSDDSPAADAGLERHDVIVSLNGEPITRVGQLQRLVALRAPGDTVEVDVVRWGRQRTASIVLGQAPIGATPAPRDRPAAPEPAGLGFDVEDVDDEWAKRLGLGRAEGVVVSDVVPWGAGDRKGLAAGDRILSIGRSPVRSAREVRRALRDADHGAVVTLLLQTAEGRTYIANIRVP